VCKKGVLPFAIDITSSSALLYSSNVAIAAACVVFALAGTPVVAVAPVGYQFASKAIFI